METKASARYIRVSPQKARLVVDLIRGKDVADAQQILDFSPRGAARVVSKILSSAVANAEHNNGLSADNLFVSRAFVDEGPTLKRFRPRAMGRATRINKRTSHITLILDEREPTGEAKRRRFRRRPKPVEEEVEVMEMEEEELLEEEDPGAELEEEAPAENSDAEEDTEESDDADEDADDFADAEEDGSED